MTIPDEVDGREFSLVDFHKLTPDLTGTERLSLFLGLRVDMQQEAWREFDARIKAQSDLAAEITAVWEEARKVPLAAVPVPAAPVGAKVVPIRSNNDLDLLRSIPSAEYIPMLAGCEVVRGFVACPLHEERTPSLHVSEGDGGWFCHGCQQGGGLLEFYSLLTGREVPTGSEFFQFTGDLAQKLGGGA